MSSYPDASPLLGAPVRLDSRGSPPRRSAEPSISGTSSRVDSAAAGGGAAAGLAFGADGIQYGADDDEFTPARTHYVALLICVVLVLDLVQLWSGFFSDERHRFVLVPAAVFGAVSLGYALIRWDHRHFHAKGYLEFYQQVNMLARFVFFSAAFGVCIGVVVFVYFPSGSKEGLLTRETTLSLVATAAVVCQLVALIMYCIVCWKHNANRLPADAHVMGDLPPSLGTNLNASPRSGDPRVLIKKQVWRDEHCARVMRAPFCDHAV